MYIAKPKGIGRSRLSRLQTTTRGVDRPSGAERLHKKKKKTMIKSVPCPDNKQRRIKRVEFVVVVGGDFFSFSSRGRSCVVTAIPKGVEVYTGKTKKKNRNLTGFCLSPRQGGRRGILKPRE